MKILQWAGITLCAVGLGLGVASPAQAYHETEHTAVTLAELPDAVRTAIEQKAKGGSVPLIEKFTVEGQPVFRAHIEKDGKIVDLDLDASGNAFKSPE